MRGGCRNMYYLYVLDKALKKRLFVLLEASNISWQEISYVYT